MTGKIDIPYAIGLISGLMLGAHVLRTLGVTNSLVVMLGGLVFGVGCGMLAEAAYRRFTGGRG